VNENECQVGDERFIAIDAKNCSDCTAFLREDYSLCESLGDCKSNKRTDKRRINWQVLVTL
jgi:hypothetical protein